MKLTLALLGLATLGFMLWHVKHAPVGHQGPKGFEEDK